MIIQHKLSIKNRRISKTDIIKFCEILRTKQIKFELKFFCESNKHYFCNYKDDIINGVLIDKQFANENVQKVIVLSKSCKLFFGDGEENIIVFEAKENDDLYNYLYTKISEWINGLKKIRGIDVDDGSASILMCIISGICILGLCVLFLFICRQIGRGLVKSIISTVVLFFLLVAVVPLYFSGFKIYEIDIGVASYKKVKKIFWFILSSCILPIITGLIF